MPIRPGDPNYSPWVADCLRWRSVVLTGDYAHWCPDWDYLPVDNTTPEYATCTCRLLA